MPQKEESDDLNPYAFSNITGAVDAYPKKPNPEFFEIEFSGTVETRDIRHYVFNPYLILIKILIPCIAIVVLTYQSFATGQLLIIPVSLVAILLIGVISYVTHASLFSVHAILKKRPWLIGNVRGKVRQERMTVHYDAIHIESYVDISQCITRHGMFMPFARRPLAILPTHCFYENEWADFISTSSTTQTKPLEPPLSPISALQNILETDRIPFLDQRRKGYRFHPSGLGFWLAVIAQVVLASVPTLTSFSAHVVSFVAIMVGTETIRIVLMIAHIHNQFNSSRKKYRPTPTPANNDQNTRFSISWFDANTLVHCNAYKWMQLPTKLIDRVIIDIGAIEFRFQDLSFVFHREGFENEERWQQARQLARELSQQAAVSSTSL